MQIGDGFIWKVQDGVTHMCGTLAVMAGQLGTAGTVDMAYTWPLQPGFRMFVLLTWDLTAPKKTGPKVEDASILRPESGN